MRNERGGARASARAPLWLLLKAKTHKNVSGEGFLKVLGGRGSVFLRFVKISGGGGGFLGGFLKVFCWHWKNSQKGFFDGFP